MISVEEALKIVVENTKPKSPAQVPLRDSFGLVLAEDIHASTDLPPFTSSAMDGYALRSEDTQAASPLFPVTLRIIEDLPAGKIPKKEITSGACAQIMTGGLLPRGADAVLMVEETERIAGRIKITASVRAGDNIRYQGEDVKKGKILPRRTQIRPQEIALLAALGVSNVPVFPKARVAVLSTGNELIPVSRKLARGKIRDSNSFALEALLRQEGALPLSLGIARDNLKSLRKKIKKGLDADMLLVAGGVSVGTHDLVKKIFEELGVKELFWKAKIKPGKPVFFGKKSETLVFGLPGNPASSFVSFEIFVRPALRISMAREDAFPVYQRAVLLHDLTHQTGRIDFVRAACEKQDGRFYVRSSGTQGSHCLSSLAQANALIRLEEDVPQVKEGEEVEVLLL